MDISFEAALLQVAEAYADQVKLHGGKSLARVATIVVNRGSFFERLRGGGGCSVNNFDRLIEWFRDAGNWPDQNVPIPTRKTLLSIGRKVAEVAVCPNCELRAEAPQVACCTRTGCPMPRAAQDRLKAA